eukprot:c3554_g1_i1.p1 GENE.c3554_g1_i1~~c3554_g1_i1.p1  ORF type:complete len:176 (-),score=37.22 c3554_g1_i1:14-508(-)
MASEPTVNEMEEDVREPIPGDEAREEIQAIDEWEEAERKRMAAEHLKMAEYLSPPAMEKVKQHDEENLRRLLIKKRSEHSVEAMRQYHHEQLEDEYKKMSVFLSPAAIEKIRDADREEVHAKLEKHRSELIERSTSKSFSRSFSKSVSKTLQNLRQGSWRGATE